MSLGKTQPMAPLKETFKKLKKNINIELEKPDSRKHSRETALSTTF